jgi:hypothetical protein
MPLKPGEPAPWFRGSTPSNPEFTFDSVAGRHIPLAFLPRDDGPRLVALKAARRQAIFDDAQVSAFVLPFLYDELGAEVLAAYQARVAGSSSEA